MAADRLAAPPADRRHGHGPTRVRGLDPYRSPCVVKISPRNRRRLAAKARRPDRVRWLAGRPNRAAGYAPSPDCRRPDGRRSQNAHAADRPRAAPGHRRGGGRGNRLRIRPDRRGGEACSWGRPCHRVVRRGRIPGAAALRPRKSRALTLAVRSQTSWPGRGNRRPWMAWRSGAARRRPWPRPRHARPRHVRARRAYQFGVDGHRCCGRERSRSRGGAQRTACYATVHQKHAGYRGPRPGAPREEPNCSAPSSPGVSSGASPGRRGLEHPGGPDHPTTRYACLRRRGHLRSWPYLRLWEHRPGPSWHPGRQSPADPGSSPMHLSRRFDLIWGPWGLMSSHPPRSSSLGRRCGHRSLADPSATLVPQPR
jgi:hypothetical protein